MYLKFYTSIKVRLLSGLVLLIAAGLLIALIAWQSGQPPSLSFFFAYILLVSLTNISVFYTLQFNLSPVLQVYEDEIIISRFTRESFLVSGIQYLKIEHGKVEISIKELKKCRTFSIWQEISRSGFIIQNGEIVFQNERYNAKKN